MQNGIFLLLTIRLIDETIKDIFMQIVITINSMDLYERNYNTGINKTPSLDILRGTSEGATITIVN